MGKDIGHCVDEKQRHQQKPKRHRNSQHFLIFDAQRHQRETAPQEIGGILHIKQHHGQKRVAHGAIAVDFGKISRLGVPSRPKRKKNNAV